MLQGNTLLKKGNIEKDQNRQTGTLNDEVQRNPKEQRNTKNIQLFTFLLGVPINHKVSDLQLDKPVPLSSTDIPIIGQTTSKLLNVTGVDSS